MGAFLVVIYGVFGVFLSVIYGVFGIFLSVIYCVFRAFLSALGKRDLLSEPDSFAPTAGGLKSRITAPLSVGCLDALKTCIFFF